MFRKLVRWFRELVSRITGAEAPAGNSHVPHSFSFVAAYPFQQRQPRVQPTVKFPNRRGADQHPMGDWGEERETVPHELTPAVRQIANAWPNLPPHIQDTILTLIDAARLLSDGDQSR